MTVALFNISITDDRILERNETFHLSVSGNSLPKGVKNRNPVPVTVTIVDDDCK